MSSAVTSRVLSSCAGCSKSLPGNEVATHGESMAILTRLARDDRTQAAIALERALRGGTQDPSSELEDFLRDK